MTQADEHPVYGCKECGADLPLAHTVSMDHQIYVEDDAANYCRNKHFTPTPDMLRFKWTSAARAEIEARWPGVASDALRKDPRAFVHNVANPRLQNEGLPPLGVDDAAKVPLLTLNRQPQPH